MLKVVIVLVALFALAFASDKNFLEFVMQNKDKLAKLRGSFRKCRNDCEKKVSCIAQCIAKEAATKNTEALEDIFSEMFDTESDAETSQSINQRGVDLIKGFEGWRSCVYKDAVGLPTIGYGHLIKAGEKFTCITPAEGESLLRKDLSSFDACVSSAVKVPLTSNQFSALVSFSFNVGCGNLKSSTLLSKLNAGDKGAVCEQLLRWNKAGGKVLPGLTRRREAECALFKA